jgi:hypothetical protein
MSNKNILDYAGKYNLDTLDIISYQQQKSESAPKVMDIKGITEVMTITEDILSNTLNGVVTVYDTGDIRSVFPLTGLERLSVKFNTPGLPGYNYTEENGTPFQIYKVDRVTKTPGKDIAQRYQIFFCSPEMFNSQVSTVSKAYSGPIENAVKDLVTNKRFLNSKKPLFIENTATNAKYVIPSLKPLKAINFLATQSVSGKYNNAGYLFFETSRGFHFRSIESLLAMGGSVARPHRWMFQTQVQLNRDKADKGQSEVKNIPSRMQAVIQYNIDKHADTLSNIIDGVYANKVVVHDAFNKTIKTHNFNYKENFAKGFHVETVGNENDADKHIVPDTQLNDTGKALFEYPDSKKMVVTETSKVHNDYEFVPVNATLPKITSQKAGLKNLNLSMLVYGNTDLNAGDIINFNLPLLKPSGDSEPKENPYIGGRYLIMAIKHTMVLETGTHEMTLRCMKDSVRTPYPSEEDPLIVGTDKTRDINIYKEDITAL